jgi:hypothetical protein
VQMVRKRGGRPRGTYGEITLALIDAACTAPGTVRELAARACVGFAVAERKAPVLLQRGDLVVHRDGRPRVLIAARAMPQVSEGAAASQPLLALPQSFFGREPSENDVLKR